MSCVGVPFRDHVFRYESLSAPNACTDVNPWAVSSLLPFAFGSCCTFSSATHSKSDGS
jgi:hypothetical protein